MFSSQLKISLYASVLLCASCTGLSTNSIATVDILTYTSSSSPIETYEKIIFYMDNENILELNLNDAHYSHLRENLNSFISDAEYFCIYPASLDPWNLSQCACEFATCYTKSGEEKYLRYTPELHLGYYQPPTLKDGAIEYDTPRIIDMRCFLRPEEAQRIKNAFKNQQH